MKNITRRKFIGAAAATAGALSLNPSMLGSTTFASGHARLARLDWTAFTKYRNTVFTFSQIGIDPVGLTLTSVDDSRPARRRAWRAGQECFVLKFTGDAATELSQDTYNVSHSGLGDFQLFITEDRRSGRTRTFYAVINRVTS